jgi:hypothetical protein
VVRHAPHWSTPAGTGNAQVRQRGTGWAKRATQASHTTRDGQAWHTAQRAGICWDALRINWRNMESIYFDA